MPYLEIHKLQMSHANKGPKLKEQPVDVISNSIQKRYYVKKMNRKQIQCQLFQGQDKAKEENTKTT
jgi:hypothetical protein